MVQSALGGKHGPKQEKGVYLPPIDEKFEVVREFRNGEIYWPAGSGDKFVGFRKIKYVEEPDDKEKSYMYRRKPIEEALPFALVGEYRQLLGLTTPQPDTSNLTPVNQPLDNRYPDEEGCQPLVNLSTPEVEDEEVCE